LFSLSNAVWRGVCSTSSTINQVHP
jgi:hypothetical protein